MTSMAEPAVKWRCSIVDNELKQRIPNVSRICGGTGLHILDFSKDMDAVTFTFSIIDHLLALLIRFDSAACNSGASLRIVHDDTSVQ